jgi:peptidoglycan/xylan/chitin deacetylase (PgdA/CDA1 family)
MKAVMDVKCRAKQFTQEIEKDWIQMKRWLAVLIAFILIGLSFGESAYPQKASSTKKPRRQVAITIDDLPVVTSRRDIERHREITSKLLGHLARNKVPAIGFVNESKLIVDGKRDDKRVDLLHMWVDKGFELGNHTFSHNSLNETPLAEFQADVIRGEEVTKGLLAAENMKLRYFRHPFLHTGKDIEKKNKFDQFLADRGYTIAPVTISNSDWVFAGAYDKATDRGDKAAAKQVADAYVPYTEKVFGFYEKQSVELFGREIRQVLLLHSNSINADLFGKLAQMLKNRGYEFILLEEALKDEAYKSSDTYVGAGGALWLYRWSITRNVPKTFFEGEPVLPEFVNNLSKTPSQ